MAELTYPGIYIEEKAGGPAPVQGVSTSILALVGWTPKGLTDDPILVSGFKEFERKFGGFTSDGLVPTMLHSFFKNGGQLARIVRVAGTGNANGKTYISEEVEEEDTGYDADDSTLVFTGQGLDEAPVEPGSIAGIVEFVDVDSTGTTGVSTAPDGVIAIWTTGTPVGGQGQFVDISGLIGDIGIQPGTVTIDWASGGAKSMTDDGSGAFTGDGNAAGSIIDYLTGAIMFDASGDIPDSGLVGTITFDHKGVSRGTVTDDGAGAVEGTNVASGTIDYTTGAIAITFTKPPALTFPDSGSSSENSETIEVDYGGVLWEVDMLWPGLAGNNFSVMIFGSPGSENDADASFTLHTFQVLEDGVVIEQWDNIDFSDSNSVDFFPLVVNDEKSGSKHVAITDIGYDGVPAVLHGIEVSAENQSQTPAIDGVETEFTFTLGEDSCYATSLVITATDTGAATMTVTDDGDGNLIGDVNSAGTNTIDYETGAVDVTFGTAVQNASVITADYFTEPDYESVEDDMAGGLDGSAVTSSNLIAAALESTSQGLYALNKTDDMLMVITPDFAGDETTDQAVLDYCENRMDRFAILTTVEGMSYDDAVVYKRRTLARNSNNYGAIYWPWVQILDPVTEKSLNIPPIGHVAGVFARTDAKRNIGKAPAGAVDGSMRFILGLAQSPTKAEVGTLTRGRVNALVDWQQVGSPAVWGARTLESNGEFGYVQARRLFMFLEKSVFNATHIYAFENNGSALWARIRLQLNGFLFRLFQQGYFAGTTPEEAYFITVDSTNNPQESVDAGELYVDVGVAPGKPAEFIVFRFAQKIPG